MTNPYYSKKAKNEIMPMRCSAKTLRFICHILWNLQIGFCMFLVFICKDLQNLIKQIDSN